MSIHKHRNNNSNSLTSINIPQSVLCIEEGAFSGCLRLKHIYCYAEKMPVTNNTSFDDIYASDVILHVSAEAVEAYKNTKPWNQIGRIVALDDKEIPSETKDVLGKGFDDEIIIKATGYISSSNVILNEVEPFFVVSSALDKDLKGCPVKCKVTQVRKSNISGSEGRLIIHPLYIKKGNEKVKVFGDIYVRGKNRTNVKFWLGFLPPMWFIPGTGAKIYKDDCFTIYLR